MTIPIERTRAVLHAGKTLSDLLPYAARGRRRGVKFVRVPVELLDAAARCLRHYPWRAEMWMAARKCPKWFGPVEETE